ncbi:hypothetical protein MKO06_08180 [Gramella sp. GC03-9]|uniref:Uncharacterized protein n=1 Tax=Christiangramia oceanisediminis TaxID=2920386 RepID=A0A9X2I279_9FLAO|nr:hypothetical protein [Gramella oceanisediminis]MCP9199879.1 hypothetical protein [Gramella oceanisediminis]
MLLKEKRFRFYSTSFLASLFGVIFIILTISINRGFDFTDEGGFLLSYKNVETYRGGIYNYHIIINKLTEWLKPGLIAYRWFSIVITLVSSLILTMGLYRWLNNFYRKDRLFLKFLFLFFYTSIGNFLFYFPGILTIYNNTLTNFFLQASTGIVLILFARDGRRSLDLKNITLLFSLGLFSIFSFFVKFPTGVIQIGLYPLIIFFYFYQRSLIEKLNLIFIFFLGVFTGALAYFSIFQAASEWYINFFREYNILSDHSSTILLKGYLFEFYAFIIFVIKYFSWLVLIPLLIVFQNKFNGKINSVKLRVLRIFILFSFFSVLIGELFYFGFHRSMFTNQNWVNTYFYLMVIILQIILLGTLVLRKNGNIRQLLSDHFKKILVISLLIVSPFIGALGTANPIFANSLIHSASWFAVYLILSVHLTAIINKQLIFLIFILLPALITTSQIVDGNLFSPYYSVFNQNKSDFFRQTEKVENIPQLDQIYVDEKTKTFLTQLKEILDKNNFKDGDPIIGFHVPGVVFLLNGISPAVPYYYNKERDAMAFRTLYSQDQLPIILLPGNKSINDKLLTAMQNKGISFPGEYNEVGEVYFPNEDSNLKVYFPKNY